MNLLEINTLVLAYLGDTIYEDYIRRFLIKKGIGNVNDLQSESLKYVSAKGQSNYLEMMINDNYLTDDELNIVINLLSNNESLPEKYNNHLLIPKSKRYMGMSCTA